ncbi:uncharacterized protein [Henckelia pumila]|uniref:uncharacterized protein n=1 Tax=Henckelia pumila TaxID=405737 RepID=UPI003C6E39D8
MQGYGTPHTIGVHFSAPIPNEPATPTFVPKTQLSDRESPIEVVNVEKLISNAEGTKKCSIWTKVEDEVLERSFVTINDDPIIGNDQKADAFLGRVAGYYNENFPSGSNNRSENVIRSRWHNTIPKKYILKTVSNDKRVIPRIVTALENHSTFFQQKDDAVRRKGLSPLQKCTAAIRQLAYGVPADHLDEYLHMGESTVISSRNDINVLYESPIFNNILQGNAYEVNFTVNDTTYTKGYYLTYEIYPEWATFVKAFPCPEDLKRKLFKERQEFSRKNFERAFGVLQSRWVIVRGPAHYWYRKKLKQIVLACIILHNMIIEDDGGHVTNWYNNEGDELAQPIQGSNRGFQDYFRTNSELRDIQVHHQLCADLVEHIWGNYNNNP